MNHVRIINHAGGIWLLDCTKSATYRENSSDAIICWHVILEFFLCRRIPFSKFSWWSKFHFDIIIGFGVMTIQGKPTSGAQKFPPPRSNLTASKVKFTMCHNLVTEAPHTKGSSIELASFQISLTNWFIKHFQEFSRISQILIR